ncbi:MAG: hypothetical protein ACYDCO_21435 [Armatimonadota bacterium]
MSLRAFFLSLLLAFLALAACADVHVRVTLLEPANTPYKVQVVAHPDYWSNTCFFVGQTQSAADKAPYVSLPGADVLQKREAEVQPLAAGQSTPWIDISQYVAGKDLATVQFFFVPAAQFGKTGVKARIDVATAPADKDIVRAITEHDPGNIIAIRVPRDPVKDKEWLISIREDAVRRLKEIQALNLPEGPLPRKIWMMTGFRPWGMYTDPAITESDFKVIQALGMNGFWDFNAETWKLAQQYGIDRTTVFWREVGHPPAAKLDWAALEKHFESAYKGHAETARKTFGERIPPAVVDLMDEPAGLAFKGPEYDVEFAKFLQAKGFTPDFFGKASWDEVKAIRTDATYLWWDYYKTRKALNMADLPTRRLFYWSAYFLTYVNTRCYVMGTKLVEKYAPEIVGTRVNVGPPFWYDYGTIPRGIEAFDLAAMRGVTMPFNEDWIGNGDPRWPLETTAFIADWDRAPFLPATPLAGGFLTRDANRTSVKLRLFGFLARDCKVFDFYYYGPSYGQFDHWSDNASMVQGVAELSRDIGRADNILWEAHPPKAKVALLYAKSWPVWKEDDTEQIELMMTYLALLHAGIPVDIVSDEMVANGRLKQGGYQCLYAVNESISAQALTAIDAWVKTGGRLWMAGWAGAKDEYNTPTDAWNAMLGITERSWKPVGDLKRYGDLIGYADHRRPYFSRHCTMATAEGQGIPGAHYLKPNAIVTPDGEAPAMAYERQYGKGLVQVITWTAGKDYLDGSKVVDGTLAKGAIIYPVSVRRDIITGLAWNTVQQPATTSVSQILAMPLWSKTQGAILIANYTGNPAEKVTVTFRSPVKVKSVTSLRAGKLAVKRRGGVFECTLPVKDVTDILLINE